MPDIEAINARNEQIAAEFRASGGLVGGGFAGTPVLLLHTRGARSGHERVNPLVYLDDAGRRIIFASYQGADRHPAWYFNLRAQPEVTIEVGTETLRVRAQELTGGERDRLWRLQTQRYPRFGDYERRTSRVIPAIALVPLPG